MLGNAQQIFRKLFEKADVRIGGDRPWDILVNDQRLYRKVLAGGSLAAGESYVDGWWDCDALDEFFCRLLGLQVDNDLSKAFKHTWNVTKARLRNLQSIGGARKAGRLHYDRGNDLFERMLDKRMIYSCGYWRDAETLDAAQEAKMDLICRKLRLQSGMRVLDIGCGWGGFALFAVERYGVNVVGITVAEEQVSLARERCTGKPIEIRLQDYREVDEQFDAVLSIGMFEHVGFKNYRTYMEVVRRCLKPQGLSLLHSIARHTDETITDAWTEKYIFPRATIPSGTQIMRAVEGLFVVEDWHNIGPDYDPTLMAWARNFEATWHEIADRYGERFYRMWRYFLLQSAGSFRAKRNQVWQIVLAPLGWKGTYRSVR